MDLTSILKSIIEECETGNSIDESEIDEYRYEKDDEKRLELCYKYQIPKEYIYPEDYEKIIADMDEVMKETHYDY